MQESCQAAEPKPGLQREKAAPPPGQPPFQNREQQLAGPGWPPLSFHLGSSVHWRGADGLVIWSCLGLAGHLGSELTDGGSDKNEMKKLLGLTFVVDFFPRVKYRHVSCTEKINLFFTVFSPFPVGS